MNTTLHSTSYNGHQLMTSARYEPAFYLPILQNTEALLNDMIARHSQVFVMMLVLKFPYDSHREYQKDNALLSRFLEAFTRNLDRAGYDPKYLWVREESSYDQVHYHLMIMVNGNKIQDAYGKLLIKAQELWGNCLGVDGPGYVHHCRTGDYVNEYGGIKIRRNSPEFQQNYANCFHWASYLAKCSGKENTPSYVNRYGYSRVG